MRPNNSISLLCPQCGHRQELTANILDRVRAEVESDSRLQLERELKERLETERMRLQGEAEQQYSKPLEEALRQLERSSQQVAEMQRQQGDAEAQFRLRMAQELGEAAAAAEAHRRQLEQELLDGRRRLAEAEEERLRLQYQRSALQEERRGIDQRIAQEREQVAREAERRLGLEKQAVLAEQHHKIAELEFEIKRREQNAEIERNQVGLDTERRVRTQLDADYQNRLAEKDQETARLKRQIEELNTSIRGSVSGKGGEFVLLTALQRAFPGDTIEPVKTGQAGGDIIHRVMGANGRCGTILWESKDTQSWGSDWVVKNQEDQQRVAADLGVIVTRTLPAGVDYLADRDRVWVVKNMQNLVEPLARLLRRQLMEMARLRASLEGHDTKSGRAYAYLVGPEFRQLVSGVVEAYQQMRNDLEKEKRSMKTMWAKRDKQLNISIASATMLWGQLEGIIGKDLTPVRELMLLEAESPPKALSAGQ